MTRGIETARSPSELFNLLMPWTPDGNHLEKSPLRKAFSRYLQTGSPWRFRQAQPLRLLLSASTREMRAVPYRCRKVGECVAYLEGPLEAAGLRLGMSQSHILKALGPEPDWARAALAHQRHARRLLAEVEEDHLDLLFPGATKRDAQTLDMLRSLQQAHASLRTITGLIAVANVREELPGLTHHYALYLDAALAAFQLRRGMSEREITEAFRAEAQPVFSSETPIVAAA